MTSATEDMHSRRWFTRRVGPGLLVYALVAGLVVLGLTVLYSVGRSSPDAATQYLTRQLVWLAVALLAFLVTLRVDFEKLRDLHLVVALGSLGLLLLVLVPGIGVTVNGAQRWIDLGPMNMQVSDFAKIGLVFTLANYLATQQRSIYTFVHGFLFPGMIIGAAFIFILLQPDYGTAALCAAVGGTMLFLAGARLLYLIPSAILGTAAFGLAVWYDPVRLQRILSFLDVEGNRADGAYQLYQGLVGFGAGGVQGVGLGNGRQQMSYLPEAHTDFVFPVIGEELGLFFTTGVVLAFLLIFAAVALRLRYAPNLFQFLLVMGSLLCITVQALINFGVVTGLLPTKGMSLPFISYGGSNLVAMFIFLGITMNCMRVWGRAPLRAPREVFA